MSDERRYEDGAEQRTVTGWTCVRCGRFWGKDEHIARYCCSTDFPCECGGRHTKGWTKCQACRDAMDAERFAKRERRPWDGKQMLCCDRSDRYFSSPEDIYEHIAEEIDEEVSDLHARAMEMRIVLCEPTPVRWFNLSEFLDDALPEDADIDTYPGALEAEKAVNDWITAQQPLSWTPGKYAWDGTTQESPR